MNARRAADRARGTAIFLVSSTMLLVAACSAPAGATPSSSEAVTASATVAATPEPTSTDEPTPTEEPTPTPSAGIGAPVQVGDEQYVTVTAVEPWEGTPEMQPAAGNAFVAVNIRIDAITTTSFTSEDFSVEDADGTSHALTSPGRSPHLSFLDGLEPDHFYAGFVTFEVPEDVAGDLTLVYTPNFLDETYEIELN